MFQNLCLLKRFLSPIIFIFDGLISIIAFAVNAAALIFCYFYLKHFNTETAFLLTGYFRIIRRYAEFISASVCFSYGLVEADLSYFFLGFVGIIFGFIVRVLFFIHMSVQPHNPSITAATGIFAFIYILTIFICSCAFHHLAVNTGVIACASRTLTSVLPFMAFAESVKYRLLDNFLLSWTIDMIAMSFLWMYCAEVSIKHFVIVPNLVGLLLTFIETISSKVSDLVGGDDSLIHGKTVF